ncbi:MAG TPA: sigma-54 dependent transcriptional regulator [Thermoanaerobaculia bacterium]|nr:sigma-54 dependent transcriptional regulator [Thermoanaerobaculia bacterium]
MLIRILLVIEEPGLYRRVSRLIAQPNVLVFAAASAERLWEGLARESADLVVVERSALTDPPGELISALRKLPDRAELIVLQQREDPEDRAALLAAGCFAVLSPALSDPVMAQTLRTLVNRRRESLINRLRAEQPDEDYHLSDFASASEAMQELLNLARRVAASDSSLLILGETGVGKEWLARAIHTEGPRASAPFIGVNLAAVPDTLLESELFGHEKGAFTGAIRSRRGYFELAHRGTIFLDEIAEMPPHLQAKLLRVLQERKIQRVGGEQTIEVDVRVMAATNRQLEEAIESKEFRSDLYYRLGVVTLTVPPLRERREDIPALAQSYLNRFRLRLGRQAETISPEALDALLEYAWPGNVRELINVMERTVLLSEGAVIDLADLPENIARRGGIGAGLGPGNGHSGLALPADWLERSLKALKGEVVRDLERSYLSEQLRVTQGRIGETARRAGLDPRSLYDKMRELGLRKEDFRALRGSSGG